MAKKANGEGSVYRRMKNGVFVGYAGFISLENGKRKYFYGKKCQEVHDKIQEALKEKSQGTLVTDSQQTIAQYLESWLEHTVKDSVRPRTYERYEQHVRLHLMPVLGRVKLQSLTPQYVQILKSKKLKEGLSPKTVGAIQGALHKALDDAVKLGLLARNVCDAVSPPREEEKEIRSLLPSQIYRLLEAAKNHPYEALFVLALGTGMRHGELLGLKWQDINFAEGTLQVRRTLTRVPTVMRDGGDLFVEAEPKTRRSRRSIVLPSFVLEALQKHKTLQEKLRREAGDAWEDHDYVFCTAFGKCLHQNTVAHRFKMLLKKAVCLICVFMICVIVLPHYC